MRVRRLASLAISAWLVAVTVVAAPPAALAAEVSFGKPSAVAEYGQSITFTVDVTRDVPLDRVELRLRFPDTLTRLHAITKADTLGLGLVVLGLLPRAASPGVALKLVGVWLLTLLASGSVSQLIARAVRREGSSA